MRLSTTLLSTALLLAACRSGQTTKENSTAPDNTPRIVFLHLRMTDSSVTLLDKSIEAGTLKQKRSQENGDGIYYELASASGMMLWRESFDDPLVRRLEYEDPDHPGELESKMVRSGEAEIMLRIPYTEGESYIEFYRVAPALSGEPARRSIGRI